MSVDLTGLNFSSNGSPFAKIAANSNVLLNALGWSLDGSPFFAESITSSLYNIYVGSTRITAMYVGSTEVSNAYVGSTSLK